MGFPISSAGKKSACSASDTGDVDSIPGSGRSPGEWNGSPLQYSCPRNPMDRDVWWVMVHVTSESVSTHMYTELCWKGLYQWLPDHHHCCKTRRYWASGTHLTVKEDSIWHLMCTNAEGLWRKLMKKRSSWHSCPLLLPKTSQVN